MDRGFYYFLIVTIILQAKLSCTLRIVDHEPENNQQQNIVGIATNIMAASVLKTNIEFNQNFVFSPFGYSSILTILNEGAAADTNVDLSSYLRHPENRSRVRSAYRDALKNLQGTDPCNAPQFRTWLYVYKNNTINKQFRDIIRNDYYVEVKDIERTVYGEFDHDTNRADNSVDKTQGVTETNAIPSNSSNSKDIPDFETLKKSDPSVTEDETRRIDDQKDASKFDEVVEDRQYVEVPTIKTDEVMKKIEDKKETNEAMEKNAEMKETKNQRQNDKMRSKLSNIPDLETEEESTMRKFGIVKDDGDGTSVLSGNSIVGDVKDSEKETKMLLFSGLYYKGSWSIPFQQLRYGPESIFYLSESEKISAKMMRSRGFYKIAEISNLKCQAIELPYENDRYSFLILLPNSRNGLKSLLAEFNSNTISEVVSQLEEESVDISMPKFGFDSTSGAEKSLTKYGLASIFTSKADFSGITNEQKLHIGELQQHVSIRVDEGSSSENFLTATNALRSNAQPERSISVDRPFLFFVRDVLDDVIIVAGKLTMPPHQDEPIFAIDP